MGKYATPLLERILLWVVAAVISILNILLLIQILSA
jgi:Mn2+/Fe2+ NRAMP family transporter